MTNKKRKWICENCRRKNEPNKRKCIYCKAKKPKTWRQLVRELDEVFSKFIRMRDEERCVTCSVDRKKKIGTDAGHYEKREKYMTRWDEKNVGCQCKRCNSFKGGNQESFAIYLQRKFGEGILEELHEKAQMEWKPPTYWLIEVIEYYEREIEKRKKRKKIIPW